ncbi:hypothetical protein [Lysinibacillus odysseyi]|uniref:Uncharacterized protein n=1 Tax=Lysinibacillus odysseyi 34hs-1 = NBRC 100172 TaxID=1220589 RepID=A0A0A3IGT4_9BACI|nr:hypothetical protein [Lysinibacillus odysseyi]KGR82033.1 hypothetical protein CD32_22330 [Lysinibacillus odysseyi 34hs-1 = NBRC 100172]
MLSEIVQTLITLWGGKDTYPTEEKINRNIKQLRDEEWFQKLFSQHKDLFLENKEIRYVIGAVNLDKVLRSEKDKRKFQEVLSTLINKKQK